jgi:hypothetical protein
VFTARYALSPYIKQIRFFFKGLMRHALAWVDDCNQRRREVLKESGPGLLCVVLSCSTIYLTGLVEVVEMSESIDSLRPNNWIRDTQIRSRNAKLSAQVFRYFCDKMYSKHFSQQETLFRAIPRVNCWFNRTNRLIRQRQVKCLQSVNADFSPTF